MSAGNTVFSIFSCLTFILVSVPLLWHLEAWNAGMCLYIVWVALGNLIYLVNSVIWAGNTADWAPVWCDISTKFMVGLAVGLPAASLCITRRLHKIATIRKIIITRADKRRDVIIDICIGVGIPVIVMALHYIPQEHRFAIFEDVGCMPVVQNSWVAFLITQVPIVVVTIISGAYLVTSTIAFRRREVELRILLSSTSTPTPNRYLRLICLAGINVVLTCFIISAGIIYSTKIGFQPWISWADTHSSFSRIGQQPAAVWRSDPDRLVMLELPRWAVVVYGLLFFAFFGFAQEARTYYGKIIVAIVSCLGSRKFDKPDVDDSDVRKNSLVATPRNSVYMHIQTPTVDSTDTLTSKFSGLSTTSIHTLKPVSKGISPLSSLDSIEMPVFHDLNSFLHHEMPARTSPNPSQAEVPFPDDTNILVLQDVSGFLQPDLQDPTPSSLPAAPRPNSSELEAHRAPIKFTRSPIITPNINTPPPHRPHSFPVSVTSCMSPPPQIIILPPPQTPVTPHSGASSESMYSMSTATDVSPHGGLFPFPLLPSSPPSQKARLHPASASFLDLDTPKASSFLDFDDPPPMPRRLSPDDRV